MAMTSRERVRLALTHQEPDRVPIHDSPWGTTVARWRQEGLPEDVSPADYFGYEIVQCGPDISLRLPVEVLEETDDYIVSTRSEGAVHRNWKGRTSTPELVDFTIKSRADWDAHKHRLAFDEGRMNLDAVRQAHGHARSTDRFLVFGCGIGYDHNSASLLGPVSLLTAMLEEPDWVREIFTMQGDLATRAAEGLFERGIDFDGAFYYDDLGYKNGLFFSPHIYRELLQPVHKMILEPFKKRDLPCILHSCGNVIELIPDLLDAGWTCLQPLEVKAGMDLIALKEQYGDQLAFMGGIDVRTMAAAEENPQALEDEIRTKLNAAKQGGGYAYYSDHSVPDNVSFASYCRVMELVRKYGAYD